MRISDAMSRRVETVAPTSAADVAWDLMRARRIRHLVVMDRRAVVGVLSAGDLGGRNGATVRRGHNVAELMSPIAVTASSSETLRSAANRLRSKSIGCLPVIDEGKLVGILTVSDVLDFVGRGAERPVVRSKRYTLKHRGPRRK